MINWKIFILVILPLVTLPVVATPGLVRAQCIPNGTDCGGNSALCCSQLCSGTCCSLPGGSSCTSAADCCSGLCDGGVCVASCVSPPADLVGWWPGDGNANDISGNFNNGTLQNGTTFAPGEVGQAFSFDGVDDQITVPHQADQNTGSQITVDAWVYPAALSHGRTIIQKRSASNVGGFTFEQLGQPFGPDGSLQWVIMIGGVYHAATATNALEPVP